MRKLLIVLVFLLAITLSGCNTTYKTEEEVITAFIDGFEASRKNDSDLDVKELCESIGYGEYITDCKAELHYYLSLDPSEFLEDGITVNIVEINEKDISDFSDSFQEQYKEFDTVYDVYVELEVENQHVFQAYFLLVKDGKSFKIIADTF